ncbi:hypothetical protein TcasGA2_TC016343 [Tribolium castaneum]|uniref:Uncharacterized protein n=1 Tax=Tribolium castaneum TaxID=7070 RepID=D6WPD2_TRICA|nr:PREDICTED: uncharacterized protein LOC107397401 [Tribolium castaneum]EFA07368.2 hypothetical protein TcasGA2_TC016343 [Tribolium castaneum]|eukprot:XP_008199966.1 PREDICTED: uncharacterized protein LOC107397401 [Tribolium castaneum]
MTHHEAHQCPSSCPHGKGAIVITITGCKGSCHKKHDSAVEEKHHQPELVESKLADSESVVTTDTLGGTSDEPKFVLPLLVGRHHGPGCAMEINVLEKHDDSCLYKKQPVPGRSLEDRVGSYECIGRIVFRTCATEEASEKKPDLSRGSGDKPPIRTPSPPITAATQTTPSPSSSGQGSKYASATSVPEKAPASPNPQKQQVERSTSPRMERVLHVQPTVANPKIIN